jgi:hypothetical protein
MADIIAIVDETGLGTQISVTTGTGSVLTDGGLPVLTSTNNSNPATVESISDIGNVDTADLNDGALLIFKTTTNKWTASTTLEAQTMEGGFF